MATAISVLDNLIREELPSVILESLPEMAPTFNYIEQTSIGVVKGGIGRQWQVEHLFGTGIAGLFNHADPMGIPMETNTNFPMVNMIDGDGSLTPFPTAVDSPHTSSIKRILSLQKTVGNFSIPVDWIQADALNASQIEQVARDIKAVGEQRALLEAVSFFMNSNNTIGRIATVTNGTTTGNITLTLDRAYGQPQYLRVGMPVDVLADSAGTPQWGTATNGTDVRNYISAAKINMVVSAMDYLSGTVTLSTIPTVDTTTFTQVCAVGDWIILRGTGVAGATRKMKGWGLNDWIAESGTILQRESVSGEGLSLDSYPQFRSLVEAVSAPLTDQILNRYIGGFLNAYTGASLDTLVTTMGVTMKYMEQPTLNNNRMFYDRTGKPLDVHGGWNDVRFSFNGKEFKWITSPLVLKGHLYGLKMNGSNIKRYMPPKVGGTNGTVGTELEFLATMTGQSSVFMVGRASTGAAQPILEAPFWQYQLTAPVDVRSIKLTGLTEADLG